MEIVGCIFLMEHGNNLQTQRSHEGDKQDQSDAAFGTA